MAVINRPGYGIGSSGPWHRADTSPGRGWAAARQEAILDPDVSAQIGFQREALAQKGNQWNNVWGALQGHLGNVQGMMTAGGQSGPSPEITVGPVWNEQQIQQRVNAQRAANDQAMQSRTSDMQAGLAGRGFGANSPLAMALGQGFQNQNLATNTANERETRLGSAQMNAGHLLQTQQAREGQFASRQAEDIERRKPIWNSYNAILAALAGMA